MKRDRLTIHDENVDLVVSALQRIAFGISLLSVGIGILTLVLVLR